MRHLNKIESELYIERKIMRTIPRPIKISEMEFRKRSKDNIKQKLKDGGKTRWRASNSAAIVSIIELDEGKTEKNAANE